MDSGNPERNNNSKFSCDVEKNVLSTLKQHSASGFDITICCTVDANSNRVVYTQAHKIILSVASPIIRDMLAMGSKIDKQPCTFIFLTGVSQTALYYLLNYVYNGEVSVPNERVESFRDAANKLQIKLVELPVADSLTPHMPINDNVGVAVNSLLSIANGATQGSGIASSTNSQSRLSEPANDIKKEPNTGTAIQQNTLIGGKMNQKDSLGKLPKNGIKKEKIQKPKVSKPKPTAPLKSQMTGLNTNANMDAVVNSLLAIANRATQENGIADSINDHLNLNIEPSNNVKVEQKSDDAIQQSASNNGISNQQAHLATLPNAIKHEKNSKPKLPKSKSTAPKIVPTENKGKVVKASSPKKEQGSINPAIAAEAIAVWKQWKDMHTSADEKGFHCLKCPETKSFTMSSNLGRHYKQAHEQICKFCKFPFINEEALQQHIQEKHEFKCPTCDNKFTMKSNLGRHQKNCKGASIRNVGTKQEDIPNTITNMVKSESLAEMNNNIASPVSMKKEVGFDAKLEPQNITEPGMDH